MTMENTLSFIAELARIVAMPECDSTGEQILQRLLAHVHTPQDLHMLQEFWGYAHQHQKSWEDMALQQFLLDEDILQSVRLQLRTIAGSIVDDAPRFNDEQIELEILSGKSLFKRLCLDPDNSKMRVENLPAGQLTIRLASGLVLWQEGLECQRTLFDSDSKNLQMAADTGSAEFPEESVILANGRLLLEIYATSHHYALDIEVIE